MNKLITISLLIITIVIINCAGSKVDTIQGKLYVSGNEPFTFLIIESEDGNIYKIECSDSLQTELWKMQGEIINLEIEDIKKEKNNAMAFVKGYKEMSPQDVNKK